MWCPEPYMTLDQRTFGNYAVCCRSYPLPYTTDDKTIEEHINSDEMKAIRKEFESGVIGPYVEKYCAKCIRHENSNIKSRRQFRIEQLENSPQEFRDRVDNIIARSKQEVNLKLKDMSFYSVEFKFFGNLCNLKCMMCHPHQSSSIAAEWKKEGKWDYPTYINGYDTLDKDVFYKEIDIIMPNTKEVKFTGGEPLMNRNILDLIQYLVDTGLSKNLTLVLVTNGTKAPANFLKVIPMFRDVVINVSVDGVFDVNDYQRVNSKFKDIDKNIDKFKIYPNTKVQLTSAVTAINVGTVAEVMDYAKYKGIMSDTMSIVLNPKWCCVHVLPRRVRDIFIERIGDRSPQIVAALEHDDPEMMKLFPEFIKRLKEKDAREGTNFLDIIPELEDELRTFIDIRQLDTP